MRNNPMFHRLLLAMSFYCCVPLGLQAEEAVTPNCYDKAQTQSELNSCASDEYTRTDTELNRLYKEILQKYKDDPKFIAKFREAQRVWLKYRDAEFEAKFPHMDEARYYGSIFPMCAAQYRAELTRERIAKLREWLNGTEEGDACSGSVDIRQ